MANDTKNKNSGMFEAFLAERRKYKPDESLQDAVDAVQKLINSKDMSGKYKGKTRDADKAMNQKGLKGKLKGMKNGGTFRVTRSGQMKVNK